MSRTLKWVLGIFSVLVVVAVIAGAVWFWQNRAQFAAIYRPSAVQPNAQATPGVPNAPYGPRGFRNNRPDLPFGYGYGFRGSMGRMMPFGPFGLGFFFFGGLLRWIIPLILLVLVAVIFYQLGKRSIVVRHEQVPPATPPAAPPAEQNPPQS